MIPTIRIEVDSLKHSMLHAISDSNRVITSEVQRAIESFPWEQEIERVVHDAMRDSIQKAVASAAYSVQAQIQAAIAPKILKAAQQALAVVKTKQRSRVQ